MSKRKEENLLWRQQISRWCSRESVVIFALGFSAGLPLMLIFSTLSLWLREAGVARSAVTFFSWAALAYSFKFVWSPLVDLLPLPLLHRWLGRRRSWLLLSQIGIIGAIVALAAVDPHGGETDLLLFALAAAALGFSGATQDIVIDAYRIESAEQQAQALLASLYIAGYRVGMLVSGAGSLFIASWFGSSMVSYSYDAWSSTYLLMALCAGVGVVTTLLCKEPLLGNRVLRSYRAGEYLLFLAIFLAAATLFAGTFFLSRGVIQSFFTDIGIVFTGTALLAELLHLCCSLTPSILLLWLVHLGGILPKQLIRESYIAPVADFFTRFGWKRAALLLLLIGCYRISDIVLGVISNLFYLDMGFSKNIIASITKSFGLGMTLLGGFLGGALTLRYGVSKILLWGAILAACTNLLFAALVNHAGDVIFLSWVIAADNLCAGIAATAFVAFLSGLTDVSFTAVQYAIFSSVMTLLPKFIGGYSGSLVTALGYQNFFVLTALLGLPVVLLVLAVMRMVKFDQKGKVC